MKARTVKMSLLAATFALISAINASAAPVDVTVNVNDAEFQARIHEILINPKTTQYKNAIRTEIMKQQSVLKPLEVDVVDPIMMGMMRNKIKGQVMTQLRGTFIQGPPPAVNPLGLLPGQIAPPPF